MNKLLLCAGPDKPEGYVSLDANPENNPHIVATVPPLPTAVKMFHWDLVELIHGIEHFHLWEAEQLLREIYECLAPEGVLVLEQPNIEFAAEVLLGRRAPITPTPEGSDMWAFYGDPSHRNPLMGHHWGWTPTTLTKALRKAGFEKITVVPAHYHYRERDFRVEAVK